MDTLANKRKDLEDETLDDRPGDLEAEALVNIVTDTVLDMEAKTLGARLSDVRAKAVEAVLADKLADVENETFHHTVGNMEAKRLDYLVGWHVSGGGACKNWRHIWQCSGHSRDRQPK